MSLNHLLVKTLTYSTFRNNPPGGASLRGKPNPRPPESLGQRPKNAHTPGKVCDVANQPPG